MSVNKITVEYGSGFQVEVECPEGSTIQDALNAAKGALGFGTNVEAHIDSIPQPPEAPVTEGDRLSVHDKACSKAGN